MLTSQAFVHLWKPNFIINECKKFQVGSVNTNILTYTTRSSTVIG